MTKSDKTFWDDKYLNGESGWDLGKISAPLKEYIDQLKDKSKRILIPGAGNAHEAEYLHDQGFENVFIVDISPTAVENFKKRVPTFPVEHVFCDNFFELTQQFDLIIEQTFFCAINPELRSNYAKQCSNLLADGGKIAGLLFNFPLTEKGPPFGGSREEYEGYFNPYFDILLMEEAYNSIDRREGRELFVKIVKK